MKRSILLAALPLLLAACAGQESRPAGDPSSSGGETTASVAAYDPERGTGHFTHVDIAPTLDQAMADKGQKIYDVKCSSCHKLTGEKLVGPGWQGVTGRHKPEWILNFVTNPDEMLNKDPKAQALLEICLVRMPQQNLTDEDARDVYEFMRKNDGVK